ncbi:MAG TPA: AarF/UbiB family protein [Candidatus Baltobacteraceae bacterium]|nr:AarF/UbiB family protein [Candidatus Baltobacteraceae bacterium]
MATLARHGIGVVAHGDEAERARHLREVCEELGTTFIKLGQVLATRGDVLPEPYRIELRKLQDSASPVPAEEIERVIEDELGAPPADLFRTFDRTPLAAASIGQVHAATLADGRQVVVKVCKPGVDRLVDIDLEILSDLIDTWSDRFEFLAQYDARGLMREFGDTLRAELDYRREAANVKLFRDEFAEQRGYALPEVIDRYSTSHVITMTRVSGMDLSEIAAFPKRRRKTVAGRVARFVLEPVFSLGVFHADPHAGNFSVTADASVAVVDFGMVGRLTPEMRRRVADVLIAMERRDAERLADRVVEITAPLRPVDRAGLSAELDRLLEQYVAVSLEELSFGDAIGDLLEIFRRFGLRLPANLALLFKALMMCEGLLRAIDPDASLSEYLEPLAAKLAFGTGSGEEWSDRLRDSARDAAQLSIELPRRIDRVMGEVERGNLRVWTRVEDVETILKRFERAVERANASMLASACIVGLAIVMLFYHPQGWQTWIGVIFWVAFAAAMLHVVRTLVALRR